MFRKLLVSFFIVSLVGLAGLFFFAQHLRQLRAQQEEAASHILKKDISITIVEGKRREEIAAQLDRAGICSYQDFLVASQNLEGYLFPDTYRFFPNTTAVDVVRELQGNFYAKTNPLHLTRDRLILASIIEREAKHDDERPLIAGVYANRLDIGMKLDADPTVQYAKDSLAYQAALQPKNFAFWSEITQDDYHSVNSTYNTYLNAGLPPGPIDNPGMKSIIAAQNPTNHDYFYFLYKNGQLLLSKTLTEQQSKE